MNPLRKSVLAWIGVLFLVVPAHGQEPVMVGHYIDVGQGLSVLLEFPCGAVLIDTGGQDLEHLDYLSGYLKDFFARRADLKNTLNTMFITHPHIDHTRGIRAVTEVCRVRNYVDNGVTEGSGGAQVRWMRDNAKALGVRMRAIDNDEITALPHKHGLTDAAIDDIACPTCDPKIVVLSGGRSKNPGWTPVEFKNWNNHSLVIRVDFGKSSFLFTGDLETPAIGSLLEYYGETTMLRALVQQVGHHGSSNGTTRGLVEAVSPEAAVIGMGRWDFGMDLPNPFTTFRYGHPRHDIMDLFSELIPGNRSSPLRTKVFDASQAPVDYTVRKRIYATGWDGDVKVSAKLDGTFQVTTSGNRNIAALELRPFDKLNPDRVWADERLPAHDSVTPEPSVCPWVECPDHRPRCLPRRIFPLRRR